MTKYVHSQIKKEVRKIHVRTQKESITLNCIVFIHDICIYNIYLFIFMLYHRLYYLLYFIKLKIRLELREKLKYYRIKKKGERKRRTSSKIHFYIYKKKRKIKQMRTYRTEIFKQEALYKQ